MPVQAWLRCQIKTFTLSLAQVEHPPKAILMPTRGIEPRTSVLQDLRSTTELYGQVQFGRADEPFHAIITRLSAPLSCHKV